VSTSASKREEALSYGATDFILSTDKEQIKKNVNRFDIVLLCAHAGSAEQFTEYFELLKNGGEFVNELPIR
jgi:D-arabinose 1-dehydrogenase-like Zn-dependent alcohol dehydrogenase